MARRLWLAVNGLSQGLGDDIPSVIDALGLLQIDTIRNVVRAQDHILWSRLPRYREGQVWRHLARRDLFEHFTHDASLLPMGLLPLWQVQFRRLGARAARAPWYQSGLGRAEVARIRDRIAAEGALSTHAFDTKVETREMWARPPHKKALEQMWYAGDLATCHRENFVKFYDLGERVFPAHLTEGPDEPDALPALCDAALGRLAVASVGEVQRFWGVLSAPEARDWAARARTVPVRVEGANGRWFDALAVADIETRLAALPDAPARMRLLNPFDPAIRDRMRLARLFGFDYRNEMFVPADQRRWGYYVYPLLDGDTFVARAEIKSDRATGALRITGFWVEPGTGWGASRDARLHAELRRFARLGGADHIIWDCAAPGRAA